MFPFGTMRICIKLKVNVWLWNSKPSTYGVWMNFLSYSSVWMCDNASVTHWVVGMIVWVKGSVCVSANVCMFTYVRNSSGCSLQEVNYTHLNVGQSVCDPVHICEDAHFWKWLLLISFHLLKGHFLWLLVCSWWDCERFSVPFE